WRRTWRPEARPHRFHHVSAEDVYGSLDADSPAFVQQTPYAPNSPYAASKAAADHLVRAYHHTYGLQVTTSNCSNNYGPYHFPEKLIPLTIINLLNGMPLPVYGDGRNVRDWLHVHDHCRAIELILEGGRVGEVYNIGGRGEIARLTRVRSLCEMADQLFESRPELHGRYPDCPRKSCAGLIRFVQDRPGHDRRYAIDCTKIERELRFVRRVSLPEGLRETLS